MKSEDLIRSVEILRDNCKSYGDDDDCEGCPFAGKDTACRLTSVIHPAEWDVYLSREETDSDHSAEARNMVEDHFREVAKKVEPERSAKAGKTITRAEILDAAKNCVCTDRNRQYGEPEDNFTAIADMWTAHLRAKGFTAWLTPIDVALMLAEFKIARALTATNQKADTYIDLAGYAACGGEIATRQYNGDEEE